MSSKNLALQKRQETLLAYSQGNLKRFHFTHKPPAVCAKVLTHTAPLSLVSLAISISSSSISLRWEGILGQESKVVATASHPAGKAPARAGWRSTTRQRGQLLPPCPSVPPIPRLAGDVRKGEDVEAVSHFLPSTSQAVLPHPPPAALNAPHGCPVKAMAQPRRCPPGTVTPVGGGDARGALGA